MSKTLQSRGFRRLVPLLEPELPISKIFTSPLGKSVLIPLGLTAAALAAGAAIHKTFSKLGPTALIVSNKK